MSSSSSWTTILLHSTNDILPPVITPANILKDILKLQSSTNAAMSTPSSQIFLHTKPTKHPGCTCNWRNRHILWFQMNLHLETNRQVCFACHAIEFLSRNPFCEGRPNKQKQPSLPLAVDGCFAVQLKKCSKWSSHILQRWPADSITSPTRACAALQQSCRKQPLNCFATSQPLAVIQPAWLRASLPCSCSHPLAQQLRTTTKQCEGSDGCISNRGALPSGLLQRSIQTSFQTEYRLLH